MKSTLFPFYFNAFYCILLLLIFWFALATVGLISTIIMSSKGKINSSGNDEEDVKEYLNQPAVKNYLAVRQFITIRVAVSVPCRGTT